MPTTAILQVGLIPVGLWERAKVQVPRRAWRVEKNFKKKIGGNVWCIEIML